MAQFTVSDTCKLCGRPLEPGTAVIVRADGKLVTEPPYRYLGATPIPGGKFGVKWEGGRAERCAVHRECWESALDIFTFLVTHPTAERVVMEHMDELDLDGESVPGHWLELEDSND